MVLKAAAPDLDVAAAAARVAAGDVVAVAVRGHDNADGDESFAARWGRASDGAAARKERRPSQLSAATCVTRARS